jgi:Dockerin type I domain
VTSPALTQGSASALFTVPAATHAGTYALRADYSGNVDFLPSSDTKRAFTVQKAKSLINWSNPADITSGTALGSAQLNATANVPGAFVYTPPANTVLSVGSGQLLTVNFIPSDSVDYTPTSASVRINVNVVVPGDLNGDGSVGCDDLAIVKASFGKKTGQAGFDPRADVNHDGIVNIIDLSTIAKLLPAGTVCK